MPCPLCPKINRWLLSQLLQISRSTKFDFVKYQRGALTLATFIKLFEENQVCMEQKFYFFGKTSFTNV